MRPLLILYRPRVPSCRAQSLQVVHTAHALARQGHEVTLFADSGGPGGLAHYGLAPHRRLRLVRLPRRRTPASVRFRLGVMRWILGHRGDGVVIARNKRYADAIQRVPGVRVVLEAHEVDSLLAEERGEDPQYLRALERRVLSRSGGVITNSPGTLSALHCVHPLPPARVVLNATHTRRRRSPRGPGFGVAYAGSLRSNKDLDTLVAAAPGLPEPLTVFCADPDPPSLPGIEVRGPVPHDALPDALSASRTLVLPLSDGLFGRHLTNPLKLWDYQAMGRPIVAADLPSVTRIAGEAVHPYQPGDPHDLVRAVTEVHDDEALRSRLLAGARMRTWDQRAQEISDFVEHLW